MKTHSLGFSALLVVLVALFATGFVQLPTVYAESTGCAYFNTSAPDAYNGNNNFGSLSFDAGEKLNLTTSLGSGNISTTITIAGNAEIVIGRDGGSGSYTFPTTASYTVNMSQSGNAINDFSCTPAPAATEEPTQEVTQEPEVTDEPTEEPTQEPTQEVTQEPTQEVTQEPEVTDEPTEEPTQEPTDEPTQDPGPEATDEVPSSPRPNHTPEPGPPCRNLFDGRINNSQARDCAAPVAVYTNAAGVFNLYATGNGGGSAFILSWSAGSEANASGLVASGVNPITGASVMVYRLGTGEYQLMTTYADGKPYIIVFAADGSDAYHIEA